MSNSKKEELVITRVFNAPKQLVFDAFTKEEHLQHWWGPAGMKLEVLALDVRPKGKFHYKMISPNGHAMYGVFNYKEIQEPEKIVFTNSFADEKGNIIKAPFDGNFPLEIMNTWTFVENNSKTTLTLKGYPFLASDEETKSFFELQGSMNEGFGKTFDQLDAYLNAKFKLQNDMKTTKKSRVSTYLNFPGNTEEAFNFYKSVFGGEFGGGGIQRFGDIPANADHPPLSDEQKKLILHAELEILGGHVLMATDAPESMGFTLTKGNNIHINLEPETKKETKKLYDALSKNGTVTMELQDMFWGAYFGSCTDKYGINWMFNCTETK
jgi:uncharacterized glyoxalase superfamily protein PhnB/uncharacterized protein YndB with AHSA1/START domain